MVFVYGCEIRRLLRLNTKGFRNIYKFNLTSVTKLKQNSYNDSAIYRKKFNFPVDGVFVQKFNMAKKSRENREFFHDFYLFCKNYCLDIVSLKFIFCVVFLQCCVTFMTRKQLRIIFGLNYEDLYKLLCSSKMMVIMHNRYFRE